MGFVARLIISGVLSSIGKDLYDSTKDKIQHTEAYHQARARVDLGLIEIGNLMRHIFSIKYRKGLN